MVTLLQIDLQVCHKDNMNKKLKERINEQSLTSKEQSIADAIMGNISKTAFLSGPQLAGKCGVSASAVTRFAQKLGYSGFPELKSELENNFRKNITPYEMFNEYLDNPKEGSIFHDSINQDIQNIMVMKNANEETQFQRCIDIIDRAGMVYSGAISGSEIFVNLLDFYMKVLGRNHTPLTDVGLSKKLEASAVNPGDVFIAVSYQRIYKEVRDAALYAKSKGMHTIAVTDSVLNPLSKVCDDVLIAPVTGASFGYTHTAPVSLVNMIVNSLAVKSPDKSLESLENIKKFWDNTDLFCSGSD